MLFNEFALTGLTGVSTDTDTRQFNSLGDGTHVWLAI